MIGYRSYNEIDLLYSSVFLTILKIFSPEVMLIRDWILINVGAYDPSYMKVQKTRCKSAKSVMS